MSVGLRPIHSVKTMTCGSDRSGIASSFIFLIDTSDATRAKPTPSRTSRRLRAQNSMIFSTMALPLLPRGLPLDRGPQTAFRVAQEVPGGHHRFALRYAAQNLDSILDA